MHRILIIIGLAIFCCGLNTYAQKVVFEYDDAGNRTDRYIDLNKSAVVGNDQSDAIEPIKDQISNMDIKIYPNPTLGELRLDISELDENSIGRIEVYTINGKKIYTNSNVRNTNLIDLHHFKNGVYILKLAVNQEQLEWKIIKQ